MKFNIEYHSCYDELLAMLFSNQETKEEKYVQIFMNNNADVSLSAHEVIIYSLLLHKCIEISNEEATITYKELQELRNKRTGNSKVLDKETFNAYDMAFQTLSNKVLKYDLKDSRQNNKITYRESNHPLIMIYDIKRLNNNDKMIHYSLGPFGMTLIESKRYSTLVPSKYFQVKFKEVMKYELALYVCKILYIERRKKKDSITIKLPSIMKNVNKYGVYNKELIRISSCLEYTGPNIKRLWNLIYNDVNKLLEQLKLEYKIKDYVVQNSNVINSKSDTKWKILFDK